jgi:hypothetical protein
MRIEHVPARADGDDPVAVDGHRPLPDGRRADGQDERRGVDGYRHVVQPYGGR